ncbi:MAG: DM13 domain-containing protein [Dehalococcoidia bacterium]
MTLTVFGEIEQFVAEDLYPHRYIITITLAIAFAAAVYAAYRLGLHEVAWRHKLATSIAAAVFLAVSIPAGDYFLSPLWERSFLEEDSPLAMAMTDEMPGAVPEMSDPQPRPTPTPSLGVIAPTPVPMPPFEPRVTLEGEFQGADDFHFGEGTALLIETAPGEYALRFEEFSVQNGPDLFVYLSPNPDGFDDDAINLGGLKATDGAFNYDVPPGTDVSQFKSAVVWCRQFSVLFAWATLGPQSG